MNELLKRAGSLAAVLACAACSDGAASAPDAAIPDVLTSDAADVRDATDAADVTDASDAGGPFALGPGEVAEVPVRAGLASVRLATPAGSERFIMVLASSQVDAPGPSVGYEVTEGASADSPSPSLVTGCSLDAAPWRAVTLPSEAPPTGAAPAVGTERGFDFPTTGSSSERITARVVATSDRAVVWADTTAAHPAVLDPAFVTSFLESFDRTIVPRERSVFGVESDIDHDGRIALLFSPLTNRTAVAFFQQCDLQRVTGCRVSNAAEVLYLTPPNVIMPPYNTPAAMNEILSHELGHLIHFGRKVLRNRLSGWRDNAYMAEGFGALAQDVIGYQAGNLYVTMAGLDQVGLLSLADVVVDGRPYDAARDGALRGGAYLFVRWLYDRGGGDEAASDGTITNRGGPAFLRALIDAPDSVATTLPTAGRAAMGDVAMDFFTTLAVSNRDESGGVAPTNPCFRYLPVAQDPITMRPRGADVFATFHGMQMRGPATRSLAAADGDLLPGGVEYLTFNASAAAREVGVSVSVDESVAPRVRVARLR